MRLQRGVDALGGAELLVERERLEVGRVAPGRGLGFDKPKFAEDTLSFWACRKIVVRTRTGPRNAAALLAPDLRHRMRSGQRAFARRTGS